MSELFLALKDIAGALRKPAKAGAEPAARAISNKAGALSFPFGDFCFDDFCLRKNMLVFLKIRG